MRDLTCKSNYTPPPPLLLLGVLAQQQKSQRGRLVAELDNSEHFTVLLHSPCPERFPFW